MFDYRKWGKILFKGFRLSTYCQWKGNPFYKLRYVKTKKWNILFLEERMYKTDAWYMIYGHTWYVSYITISDMAVVRDTYDWYGGRNSGKDLINHFIENN